MLNRAKVVHHNFQDFVAAKRFPAPRSTISPSQAELSPAEFLNYFRLQITARHIDLQARWLKDKQQSFYTIASAGHEGNVVLGKVFPYTDPAFIHYRSSAFMLARSQQLPEVDGIRDQLLSITAAASDPISGGRHKVFGSYKLNVPPQTSTIASHLPKAFGTAFSITRAKALKIQSRYPSNSVVLCSFGDGSMNHSTLQGTLNTTQWLVHRHFPLPMVFICEDNGFGISVPTPENWVETQIANQPHIHYIQADGLHLPDVYCAAKEAEKLVRTTRLPVFLHVKTVRLMGHAGSDIESLYLSQKTIEDTEFQDPLLHSARICLSEGYATTSEILSLYNDIEKQVAGLAEQACKEKKLQTSEAVMSSIVPPSLITNTTPPLPNLETLNHSLGKQYKQRQQQRSLCQQINLCLNDLLLQYDNLILFGEDVGTKGGVYHVTANLQKRFGHRRIFDAILDEQSILGLAIGLAHNNFIPMPEIQFLAYLHNAVDQIRGEAATLSFFSQGQYTNPMVIRVPSLAYQKGFGGHFHNDNAIAFLREIPGIIIACPSNGADAARMLRTCMAQAHEKQRIVVFLEPIALYNTKDLHQTGDNAWLSLYPAPGDNLPLGELAVIGESKDLVILSYGNGYYLSRQAQHILAEHYQLHVKVIDLRWLHPLNEKAILEQVRDMNNVLIVDECRKTGSLSEALCTLLLENLDPLPNIRRITAKDSFIPLGSAANLVLPQRDDIVAASLEMCQHSAAQAYPKS